MHTRGSRLFSVFFRVLICGALSCVCASAGAQSGPYNWQDGFNQQRKFDWIQTQSPLATQNSRSYIDQTFVDTGGGRGTYGRPALYPFDRMGGSKTTPRPPTKLTDMIADEERVLQSNPEVNVSFLRDYFRDPKTIVNDFTGNLTTNARLIDEMYFAILQDTSPQAADEPQAKRTAILREHGVLLNPTPALSQAMDRVRTNRDSAKRINATPADCKLVASFMQANSYAQVLYNALDKVPAADINRAWSAYQRVAPVDSKGGGSNELEDQAEAKQASDQLNASLRKAVGTMGLSLGPNAFPAVPMTPAEVRGLAILKNYFSAEADENSANLDKLCFDSPEVFVAKDFLFSGGDSRKDQSGNPGDFGFDPTKDFAKKDASPSSTALRPKYSWDTVAGRMDRLCETRSSDRILREDEDLRKRDPERKDPKDPNSGGGRK